ncbi:hypothetical protein V499_00757 [Pseudogymnoascus sp. VKM F-103]|nr:hypothetical protein V499_00757 [Pseudogymnoascus sp. VKM F-103]
MTDSADMELPSLKALQTGEQMELLNIVDSLRAEGLGEITALPQLIVCGDQSSGKSSVLEAISGIPFPRKENTCTRFATEVILRRSPESRISVSVVPSRDREQADREKLLKFRHQLSTPDDFPDLFDKAKDAMLNVPGKSFSKDILRIEFCGPSQPQLTLVDLPGLIHSHIEAEQQTPEDVKLVTELVSDYLKSPRSIILAIVSAKYDINVQVILNRAREVDPQGIRTLGIITKPDTLVKGSESEDSFVKLARNERVKFRLGWHVVKNLDSAHKESLESTLETRNTEEKAFFKGSNFKSLPSQNVGIESLRTQLSKILFNQIRLELPRLVDDIEQRILTARASKDKLGPSRTSIDDQRSFLIQLSQTFQTICQAAVRGDYDNDFFHSDELREKRLFQSDELSEKRLCAILMDKHFGFADNLLKKGCQWTIGERSFDTVGFTFDTKRRTREEAIADASAWSSESTLGGRTFPFLDLVLQHLTDDDVREKILRLWLEPVMAQKLETAYGKLDELLEVHKEHPFTTNHHFMDNRKKLQQKDTKDEIQQKLLGVVKAGQKLSVEDITLLVMNLKPEVKADMDTIAAEDAFDNMMAYYEVAMKLFMDNVPTLAIQAPIVRKLDEVLCPTAVFRMPPDLVAKIAGESEEKMQEREEILSKLSTLETGAQICRQYAMRPQSFATAPLNPPFKESAVSSSTSSRTGLFGGGTPSKGLSTNSASGDPPSASSGTGLFGGGTPSKGLSTNSASGDPPSASSGTGLFGGGTPSKGLSSNAGFGASLGLTPETGLFGSAARPPSSSQTSQTGFGGFGPSGISPKPSSSVLSTEANAPKSYATNFFEQSTSENAEAENENKPLPWQPILPIRFTMDASNGRHEFENGHGPTPHPTLLQHISAMPQCINYSAEELRLSDLAHMASVYFPVVHYVTLDCCGALTTKLRKERMFVNFVMGAAYIL